MANLGTNAVTLVDVVRRQDPNGKVAPIAELLSLKNEIISDMSWVEGNLTMGHRTTVRTGLPGVTWKTLNAGVAATKSTTAQIDEGCAILESWSEIDEDVVKLSNDISGFRFSEAQPHLEAMAQEFAATLFTGTASAPEEFIGLNARYASLGQNCISAGGVSTDNSSIWLVVHGDQTFHGIYPKGTSAGLSHEDYGVQTIQTAATMAGARLRAYQERFQWMCGIALRDWRYVVRIPNIDISNLRAKSSNADLPELMIKAMYRPPSLTAGKSVFYMNRDCLQMLDILQREDVITGGGLTFSNVNGEQKADFRGIPIHVVDALGIAEAQVA